MKTEYTVIKVRCIQEMVGKEVLLVTDAESYRKQRKLPVGEKMFCEISYGGRHNLKRHDLFQACVSIVAENLGESRTQVIERCKIDCRWYSGFTHYRDKNGSERINVMTKSIKFSEMTLADADEFYSRAFEVISDYIGVSSEKLVSEAKERMGV
jgi:hypothetical protein